MHRYIDEGLEDDAPDLMFSFALPIHHSKKAKKITNS